MSEKTELQNRVHELCDELGIKYRIKENNQWQQKYRSMANKKYKGIPDDEIYIKGGRPLLFEYKIGYNKLTKDQEEWRDYFKNKGYLWYLIRDYNDAVIIILFSGIEQAQDRMEEMEKNSKLAERKKEKGDKK